MNCPKHYTPLDRSVVNGRENGRCPDCAGVWIPGQSIDALLEADERLKLRSLCSASSSDLICPHDHEQLGEATIAGVTIDLCPACNGLWLEQGDLEQLRTLPPMTGSLRAKGEGSDNSVLEIIAEGIFASQTEP